MCCWLYCFIQGTKENFLNTVKKTIFTHQHGPVYLSPIAKGIQETFGYFAAINKDVFGDIAPINVANELYGYINGTNNEYWNCKDLKRIRCTSNDNLKSNKYNRAFYSVSVPIFSRDKTWCLISLQGTDTRVQGSAWGKLYLFQMIDGRWKEHLLSEWMT